MDFAAVRAGVADVRARPDHASERVNQALFGEGLRVSGRRDGFVEVIQYDGYRGWVDERLVCSLTSGQFEVLSEPNAIVSVSWTRPRRSKGKYVDAPWVLYFGTRVRMGSKSADGYHRVEWPGEDGLWIRGAHLRPLPPSGGPPLGRHLVIQARRFLGVPYLWGGVTTTGFDCSGLVRTVAASFGLELPRDTRDQIAVGESVEQSRVKSGDLLFFQRHVAIAMSQGRFIHASRAAGGVSIHSLRPGSMEYRADLADTYEQARRVV